MAHNVAVFNVLHLKHHSKPSLRFRSLFERGLFSRPWRVQMLLSSWMDVNQLRY